MLQTRWAAFHLAQRPYRFQYRGYVDTKPPDPTNSDRQPDNKPVNEPIGVGTLASDILVLTVMADSDYREVTAVGPPPPMLPLPAVMNPPTTATTLNLSMRTLAYGPSQYNVSTLARQIRIANTCDCQRGFYVSIAAIALSFALYKFSRSSSTDPASAGDPDAQPLLTRIITYYQFLQNGYAEQNALHTRMAEQAAADKNLFQRSPWTHHIELKFPEYVNRLSPHFYFRKRSWFRVYGDIKALGLPMAHQATALCHPRFSCRYGTRN